MNTNHWALIPSITLVTLAATLLACRAGLSTGGSDDAGTGELDSASVPHDSEPGDAWAPGDSEPANVDAGDGGFPLPAECANPGPFTEHPTGTSLPSQLVGTWINCDKSWFAGASVPIDEVGILIRADHTWQKLAASGGKLIPLTRHYDYGTWTIYGGGCCGEMMDIVWDTSSLASGPLYSADGRSVFVTTAAGGNQATLAKATGTP